jgi:hypothetical protein
VAALKVFAVCRRRRSQNSFVGPRVLRDDGAAGGGGGFGDRIGWAADPKSSTTQGRDGEGREPISGDTGYIEKVRVRLRLCGAGTLCLAFGAALPCGPPCRAAQPAEGGPASPSSSLNENCTGLVQIARLGPTL